jgi:hypothetical protein
LLHIANNINQFDSKNFFYKLATSIISSCKCAKKKIKNFEFNGNMECALFLIKKYIDQGGRCAYSNVPIYPKIRHMYKLSPERINPTGPYSTDNVVLIVVGLNGQPSGQFLNNHLNDEERLKALKLGKFNQEYWNSCTKIDSEINKKCQDVKNYGKQILLNNLNDEMKNILKL